MRRPAGPRALLLVTLLASMAAPCVAGDAIEQRIAAVRTLVNESTAARRVESSGNLQAIAGRDAARAHLDAAVAAHAVGDSVTAEAELRHASAAMIAATQQATAGTGAGAEREAVAVGALIDSARSLVGAARRVSTETQAPVRGAAAIGGLESLLAEAERARTAGDLSAARRAANRAYLGAKLLLTEMRQGATLVRTLKFASAAEEYAYELDRHEAHRMILQLVRAERTLDASSTAVVEAALRDADLARDQAQAAAGGGDHRRGIELLDAATRSLLGAIRRAGLYVPG